MMNEYDECNLAFVKCSAVKVLLDLMLFSCCAAPKDHHLIFSKAELEPINSLEIYLVLGDDLVKALMRCKICF